MGIRLGLLILQWVTYASLSDRLENIWGYSGIGYERPSWLALAPSLVAVVVVAAFLTSRVRRPSDAVLWLLATFVVVPTTVVSAVNPNFGQDSTTTAFVVVLLGFTVVALLLRRSEKVWEIPATHLFTRSSYSAMVAALILASVAVIVFGYGVRNLDLSFGDVYARRFAAREQASPFFGATYLVAWLKSVFVPLAFVLAILWKRPTLALLGSVGCLAIFSFTGEKSAFIYPVLAVILVFSLQRGQRSALPWFGFLITLAFVVIPTALGRLFPSVSLDYLVTRRFGLTPGLATHYYVEYAMSSGYTWYSQSWLRPFSSPGEATSVGYRVGDWLDPGSGLNANAHLWADGYASAGLLGVLIAGLLLGILLRVFDRLAESRDRFVAGAFLATVSFFFVNGYFHSSLLDGGAIVSVLLVWAMPALVAAIRTPRSGEPNSRQLVDRAVPQREDP